MAQLPTGIHYSMPYDEYRAHSAISRSDLAEIERSPRHCEWRRRHPRESRQMDLGRAVHCAILEPDEYEQRYVVAPDFGDMRSSTNRAKRDEWAAGETRIVLQPKDHDKIMQITQGAARNAQAAALIGENVEVTAIAEIDGVMRKARADIVVDNRLIDIKTTRNAAPGPFARSVADYGYHEQAAWYLDVFAAAAPFERPPEKFVLIAIENEPPYECAVYEIDEQSIEAGRRANAQKLHELQQWREAGETRGYPETVLPLTLPAWELRRWGIGD